MQISRQSNVYLLLLLLSSTRSIVSLKPSEVWPMFTFLI